MANKTAKTKRVFEPKLEAVTASSVKAPTNRIINDSTVGYKTKKITAANKNKGNETKVVSRRIDKKRIKIKIFLGVMVKGQKPFQAYGRTGCFLFLPFEKVATPFCLLS